MNTQSQRTQIILPKVLRGKIDRQRRLSGESLGEYLRKAAEQRLRREEKKKVDLKKLAQEVLGTPVKKSGWDGIDAVQWQREIRAESEERLEKQWHAARKAGKRVSR